MSGEAGRTVTPVQERKDDGLNQCGSRRSRGELSDSGYILKEEGTGFADGLAVQ